MQVVDVGRIHQSMHGRIDGWSRTALAVQRVVEGCDHLVLAVEPRVDVDERPHPVEAQHRETGCGQGAEIATRALHPE